jgi:hypothetical protein
MNGMGFTDLAEISASVGKMGIDVEDNFDVAAVAAETAFMFALDAEMAASLRSVSARPRFIVIDALMDDKSSKSK